MLKVVEWKHKAKIIAWEKTMLDNVKVFGIDTETLNGQPHTLQFYGESLEKYSGLVTAESIGNFFWTTPDNATDVFFAHIDRILASCDNAIIYGFNLKFDLPIIFWKYYKSFVTEEHWTEIDNGYKITILYAQNCFAIMERDNKKVFILDVRNFFRRGSLDYLAEFFKLGVRKLDKPVGLGEQPLTEKDIPYAMRDAEIAYKLGLLIRETDKQFGLDVTFSCAGLAENIFRQEFVKDTIYLPDKAIVGSSLMSYHGGRNWYKYDKPVIVKNCYEYDIKSAYPFAMSTLPDFSNGKYQWSSGFQSDKPFSIMKVQFKKDFPSSLAFLDSGRYAAGCCVSWITYNEFVAIQKYGNFVEKVEKQVSFIPNPTKESPPLKEFVNKFYVLRSEAKAAGDVVKSEMYKLIMNSLYGKFIQTIAKDKVFFLDKSGNLQNKVTWVAAGLFHPFIASLITGIIRGQLLETELYSKACHSSTDSIKTVNKIITGENLGDWEEQVYGDCIILRNRLYLHYDTKGNIAKCALHGFRGRPETLEQAVYDGKTEIETQRILWPKEANRQHKQALTMISYKQKLSFEFEKKFTETAKKLIDKQREKREKNNTVAGIANRVAI